MRGHNHVKGGTNAGWRNPFAGAAMPWQCGCVVEQSCICYPGECPQGCEPACPRCMTEPIRKTNIGALVKCPDCGTKRPS